MVSIFDLIDLRKMCWPAYMYLFVYILSFAISEGYYLRYKKTLCVNEKIDNETIESCIVDCTTFNYFHNFVKALIYTFVLNILCKFGSYIGSFIAFLLFLFSLIPLWYIIKIIYDKNAKQKDLKC